MTNGEKIKEIFPSTDSRLDERTGIMLVKWVDGATKCFKADWWNSEYKEPTTKNDLGVDAVSRQAVLELIADDDLSMGQVVRGIHALPSVTPQNQVYTLCEDCRTKMDEVRRAYDNAMKQESIIDKIRAEIDAESAKSFRYPNWERAKALEWALSVIDKHNAEIESQESEDNK